MKTYDEMVERGAHIAVMMLQLSPDTLPGVMSGFGMAIAIMFDTAQHQVGDAIRDRASEMRGAKQ